MLKFRSHHTPRISNSLAVFATLMLLVSALVGIGDSIVTAKDPAVNAGEIESDTRQVFVSEPPGGNTQKTNKSFKASLFLFRID